MYGNLILPIFITLLVLSNGQQDDERDLPPGIDTNKLIYE
jgi:hypothetical protein